MRELIRISDKDLQQLQNVAIAFPELRSKIERAIRFRGQVLGMFDTLAGGEEERPVAEILALLLSPEPYAAEMERGNPITPRCPKSRQKGRQQTERDAPC
jgi:hypothetical protein